MENYNTEENNLVAFGGEIKALGDGKIGGYLIRFSDENTPDLVGDFFNAKTQITIPDTLPLLYNHGMDKTIKKRVIGKVTTKVDDVGVWADSQMDLRDEYEKAIYAMAENGKLGYSSGALSHLVDREPAGKSFHIKTWFVGEASLTPTPAEARNTVRTIKSLQTPDTALTDKDDNKNNQSEKMENNIMDELEIKNLVAQGVNEALKAQADAEKVAADKAAEVKAANEAGYKQAIEDLKNLKTPAYHSTSGESRGDDNDGMQAFKSWMQTGEHNSSLISPAKWDTKAAFNVTTGASGAYLVPDPLYNQIIAKRANQSFIRQLPYQSFVTPADHILVPVEDTAATAFVATAEAAAYDENEATVAQKDIILHKYTKLTKTSEEFGTFNTVNFESWLSDSLARAEASLENTLFLTGSGTGEAQGALTGATAGNTVTTSAVLVPADVSALIGQLGAGYNVQGQTALVMKNATKWYLKGLPVSAAFAFSPTPNDFWGVPTVINDNMSAYTVASSSGKSMLFGNWNFYGVAEKPGMMVQRNPYLFMGTGQIGIYASVYRGGAVLQSEAFYYSVGK